MSYLMPSTEAAMRAAALLGCETLRLHLSGESPGATVGVPPPAPTTEFPMSPRDFLTHFLSSDALRILRLIHQKPLSGKEIAAALDLAAEDKSPTPELRFRLKDLKERGLVEYDGKEYRLAAYALALDGRISFLSDS